LYHCAGVSGFLLYADYKETLAMFVHISDEQMEELEEYSALSGVEVEALVAEAAVAANP
jgi:hypothetical protein